MSRIKLIITDLDNTIYNWVDFYVPSLLAMVAELAVLTGIPEGDLKGSLKRLHQRYRTSEYSFAVHKLDVLAELNQGLSAREVREKYEPAITAFRRKRRETLRLYDGVRETLMALRGIGKKIAAHTDSLFFHAARRLSRYLRVDDLYDAIAAPPDHGFPEGVTPQDVRYYDDPGMYECKIPIQITLEPRIRKPDPAALTAVVDRMGVCPEEALYVGDSLLRDLLMAQRCGVHDVYAKYGVVVNARNYEELLKITYWTEEDVMADQELKRSRVVPSWQIERFSELVDVVRALDDGVRAGDVRKESVMDSGRNAR